MSLFLCFCVFVFFLLLCVLSPVSIQTQSLALRALRKRKPQETQAIAFEWKPGVSHKPSGTLRCHHFSPGPWLPSQPQSIAVLLGNMHQVIRLLKKN